MGNLTDGRLVAGFLRGTPNEDQVYSVNPAEGRGRLLESMDLILKALTEPQPFSWEGRYYQYRTVSVWPRTVQQPVPPVIVGTRSDDTIRYAAENRLGLGVSFLPVDEVAVITNKYRHWCEEAGWTPKDQMTLYIGAAFMWRKQTNWLPKGFEGLMSFRNQGQTFPCVEPWQRRFNQPVQVGRSTLEDWWLEVPKEM
ncbi:MAG: hypothetical protein CM1200mP22_03730 [Dehalococcoidia bacterium]|nr:MAG: hypothetical protein CM1200mP22_03730 [Dehalococcoidia bacterium]